MAGLLDFLKNLGGNGQMPAGGMGAQPSAMGAGTPGAMRRGPDGKMYQYAETTGMARDDGSGQGWLQTNMGGGGMFGGLSRFNENNPALLMGLGDVIAGRDPRDTIMQGQQIKATRKRQNATRAYLVKNGYSDEEADMIMGADPQILAQALKPKGGDDVRYGLNPIYGEDAQGNTVLGTLGTDGSFKPIDTGGFNISTGVDKVDAGTHFILIDKRSGQVVGQVPKENYQEAYDTGRGTADGKVRSEAQAGLPGAEGIANLIDMQIQDLKNDQYLPNMVGPVNSRLPNVSADAARVQSKIDQIQGGAFLQARQLLKGGGAITDYEGQKAEAAFVRMNQAQSVDDFKAALDEFNAAVQQGMRKLQQQAGGSISAPQGAPQGGGGVVDYKDYFGGQ